MSRTLKIFFIVLGLSIFILPKQMIYAQTTLECCDQKSIKDDCCKTEKTKSCHTDQSKNKSEKTNCGDDCNNCHSCTVHFVMNYLTPEFNSTLQRHFFIQEINFEYGNSYFSSNIQNIWQPPKIG
ncbi:hypothetical protein Q73A0000_12935 [Kaistella flava (ex Peng et al. 2021)]|uniref:Uncharacterized protein n=1 Tax=Kaistella flava (ex Peng et al. 2021) TaxID=2038776 RepID=A0A7M2YC19_9FLAO|nr:hypothetical protein [Kaistella flava (ex Peng et al. 2021)]QOW11195.1 hypothetical protein Q73A0000_12935 [Kaistella flava (ex Peng et al. 2021)]